MNDRVPNMMVLPRHERARLQVTKDDDGYVLGGRFRLRGKMSVDTIRYLDRLAESNGSIRFNRTIDSRIVRRHVDPAQWKDLFGSAEAAAVRAMEMPTETRPKRVTRAMARGLSRAARAQGLPGVSRAITRLSNESGGLPPWWFQSADEVLGALIGGGASVDSPRPGSGTLGYRLFWLVWLMLSPREKARWQRLSVALEDAETEGLVTTARQAFRDAGVVWDEGIRQASELEALAQSFQRAYNGFRVSPRAKMLAREAEGKLRRMAGALLAPLGKQFRAHVIGDVMLAWGAHMAGVEEWGDDWMNLAMLDPRRSFDYHPWIMRDPRRTWQPEHVPFYSARRDQYSSRSALRGGPQAAEEWSAPDGTSVVRSVFVGIDKVKPRILAEAVEANGIATVGELVDMSEEYVATYGDGINSTSVQFASEGASELKEGRMFIARRPEGMDNGDYWNGFDKPIHYQQVMLAMFLDLADLVQQTIDAVEVPRGSVRRTDPMGVAAGRPLLGALLH